MSKLFEIEETRKMSREEAADFLRRLADSLARHNQLEFSRGGVRFTVAVADVVEIEIEIEIESDESSIEIELSW